MMKTWHVIEKNQQREREIFHLIFFVIEKAKEIRMECHVSVTALDGD